MSLKTNFTKLFISIAISIVSLALSGQFSTTFAQSCAGGSSSTFQTFACSQYFGCVSTTIPEGHSCGLYPGLSSCNNSGNCGYCRHPGQTCTASASFPYTCTIEQIPVNAAGCSGTAQWDNTGCYCSLPTPPPGATPPPGGCTSWYSGVQGATCQNWGSDSSCGGNTDCKCGTCSGNVSYHATKLAVVYEDVDSNGIWNPATEQRLTALNTCTNAGVPPALTSTYLSGLGISIDDNWTSPLYGGTAWNCNIDNTESNSINGCSNPSTCDKYALAEHSCLSNSACGSFPGAIQRFQPNYSNNSVTANQNLQSGPVVRFVTHNVENGGQSHRITITAPSGWTLTQVKYQGGLNSVIPPYGCVGQSCNYNVIFDSAPADGCSIGCDASFLTIGMKQLPPPSCTVDLIQNLSLHVNESKNTIVSITSINSAQVTSVAVTSNSPAIAAVTSSSPIATNFTNTNQVFQPTVRGVSAGTTTIRVVASFSYGGVPTGTCSSVAGLPANANGTVTVNAADAWWQIGGASILVNGNLSSSVPSTCASCYFDAGNAYGLVGVHYYGSATAATFGTSSQTDNTSSWLVQLTPPASPYPAYRTTYNYAYFENLSPQVLCPNGAASSPCYNNSGNVINKGDLKQKGISTDGYRWVKSPSSTTLNFGSGNGNNDANGMYVVFVDGNLTINSDVALNTLGTDFITFIVSGNIYVDASVGRLDGIYITNGNFYDLAAAGGGSDKQLVVNGSVVAWGTVNSFRDLGTGAGNGGNGNSTTAAFKVNYVPQLNAAWPLMLSHSKVNWKEVNP